MNHLSPFLPKRRVCAGRSFGSAASFRPLRVAVAVVLLAVCCGARAQSPWKLVWSDEFDGAIGAPPSPANWKFQSGVGAAIAGNDEAEVYCAPASDAAPCKPNQPNAYLDGKGHMVIVAVKTDQTVTVGPKKTVSPVYTSARLNSLKEFQYGRIEASIRIPEAAKGVWPAFWAMGDSTETVHWPSTGEIDIMEQWNPQPGNPDKLDAVTIHGSVHGPKEPGSSEGYIDSIGDYKFPGPPSNGLHQYAVEWSPGEVDFYIDGYLYSRQSVASLTGKEVWEEDRGPVFMLLNLAMGGGFFGYPDASTGPTPTMVVDYVRVYQRDEGSLPTGWGNADIGGPAEAGSALFHNGVWTVAGSGAGIAGRFDQFQFAYTPMANDGEVTAHVIDQSSKVMQAKAGVMLRQGRGAATLFAMAFVSPDGSVHFRYRGTQGDVPSEVLFKGPATWLKVGRLGDVFTGYASTDGKDWTPIGNTKIAMTRDVDAGLIATARDNKTPNTARFDYVDVIKTDGAWDGVAAAVPGFVQAENFDAGGAGYTYSAEFKDNGKLPFRTGESLPIEVIHADTAINEPGGYYLAHLAAPRYINYAVQVAAEADYALAARVASAGKGGTFHFNIDQVAISKPVPVPDTGGDGKWQIVPAGSVHLTAGRHVLALVTDSSGVQGTGNFDFFTIRSR